MSNKTCVINLRLDELALSRMRAAARSLKLNTSDFIRNAIDEKIIRIFEESAPIVDPAPSKRTCIVK